MSNPTSVQADQLNTPATQEAKNRVMKEKKEITFFEDI
jgi:hypothetical protein